MKNIFWSFLALVLLGAGGGCNQQPASAPQAVPAPVAVRVAPVVPENTSERLRFVECATQWGVNVEYRDGSESGLFTILESLPDTHDQLRTLATLDIIANNADHEQTQVLTRVA